MSQIQSIRVKQCWQSGSIVQTEDQNVSLDARCSNESLNSERHIRLAWWDQLELVFTQMPRVYSSSIPTSKFLLLYYSLLRCNQRIGGKMTGHTGYTMTLANSIIGVGILAMPFCFQKVSGHTNRREFLAISIFFWALVSVRNTFVNFAVTYQ